jgi:hypothetical protein
MSSDLYFRIKHISSLKSKLVCRFALNPAFVDKVAVLDITELDPDKIHRNKKYDRH